MFMNKLIIDREFQDLIPPLATEEFNQLELNILKDGIRDPIICWGNIVIDGHNRYNIANKYDLKFQIIEKDFCGRDSVIDWMINNQLGRRNLNWETQSYLRGLQYEREKKKESFNGNQYTKSGESYNTTDQIPTAERLAIQHNIHHDTIYRDANYSKAIDTITANTAPEVKHKMLNREIKTTKKDVRELAKLEPTKQKEIIEKSIENGVSIKEVMSGRVKRKPEKREQLNDIPDVELPELRKMLEKMVSNLSCSVHEISTEIYAVETLGSFELVVSSYAETLRDYAIRIEQAIELKRSSKK